MQAKHLAKAGSDVLKAHISNEIFFRVLKNYNFAVVNAVMNFCTT
jgi:hypothetical protein